MARSAPGLPPQYYAAAGSGHRSSSSSSSPAASCVVAVLFLLLAAGGAAVALFLLFRPRAPAIAVMAVHLPAFAVANGTVAFTFQQLASVRNPNRSPLAHYDSSLHVAYAGGEVGSMYIPAGQIDGGRTQYMATSFTVPAFAVSVTGAAAAEQPTTISIPASGPSSHVTAALVQPPAASQGQGHRSQGVHPPRRGRQGVPHWRLAGRRPRARLPVLTVGRAHKCFPAKI